MPTLSQQPTHFSPHFSFCLSLFPSVPVFFRSVSQYPILSIFLWDLLQITVDFRLGDARVCSCVLFQGHMSFNNPGFCSVWLASSGVPLLFQCLAFPPSSRSRHGEGTGEEKGRKVKCSSRYGGGTGMALHIGQGEGRLLDS